jgi:ribose transport system ATP-binding protein
VIAKWMATEPKLLLLMDPTRGIDVGTKQEIYRLFRQLAADGMAILFYSSDYDELIGLCGRALIMYGGRITTSLSGDALNEHNVLSNALNLTPTADTRRAGAELRLVEQTS